MGELRQQIMRALTDIRTATLIGVKDTLNLDECALLTGLTTSTLYVLTSKREIPHYKRGRMLYFSKREVEDWLKGNPIKTTAQTSAEAATYIAIKRRAHR